MSKCGSSFLTHSKTLFKSLSDAEELSFVCLIHYIKDEHYQSVILVLFENYVRLIIL